MFVRKSTHEAEIKALQNLVLARDAEIVDILQTNYALDRTAARYKRERDVLRAKVAKMTSGLRQNRKPASNGGDVATNFAA